MLSSSVARKASKRGPSAMLAMTLMKTPYLFLLFSAALMPPLFGDKVTAYPNPRADFAHYKTYQWFPPRVVTKTGIDENNPANSELKLVLGQQLSQKGLTELSDGADLQIQVWVLTETVPQIEAMIMAEVSIDISNAGVSVSDSSTSITRYNRKGTIYFNLIDSRTKKSAWFAMVSDSLPTGTLKPEQIHEKLSRAATELFKKYPVKK
jgi:Domain of unknown function (DUF4136)